MHNWFYNPDINFQMWGTSHILTIIFIVFLISSLFLFRQQLKLYRNLIRITAGLLLIISRISLDIWYIQTGSWDISSSLPLELCSIASLICGIMLLTKNYKLFEVFYFIAIGGALQAILTPNLNFGFPQFRFFQFFIDHSLLILAPLIMILLYNFKVTLKSVWRAFIGINVIALIVFIINHLLTANYMFLKHKPTTVSILDYLGSYPWYLLSLEGITLVVFLLLFLPFTMKKK